MTQNHNHSATLDQLGMSELVERAQGGSKHAFAEVVRRFDQRLLKFLRRCSLSEADAQDIAQEAFLRAWQQIDRYDSRWAFSTWLYTIARRLASTHRRKLARSAAAFNEQIGHPAAEETRGTPDVDPLDMPDQTRLVWSMVEEHLSEAQRVAVWLRYADAMPIGTIAHILGKSPVAVRVLLHRARSALATKLAENERTRAEANTDTEEAGDGSSVLAVSGAAS